MRPDMGRAISRIFFFMAVYGLAFFSSDSGAEDPYSFDIEEYAVKAFEWGGYTQVRFEHMNLDTDGSFYRLNFHQDPFSAINRYSGTFQPEFRYKKGIWAFNGILHAEAVQDDIGWSDDFDLYEADFSLKPSPFVTADIGKMVFRWGKGYAWNPVGFMDRPKDPDNPEESLEGYCAAGLDFIKSLDGHLKTVALTTAVLPVQKDVNDDFGDTNHVNIGAKLYLLYRDIDIDFMMFGGGSRPNRYGVDFSANLAENLEIHGEFAHIVRHRRFFLTESGSLSQKENSANLYLLGMRYLTESDVTTIVEYYHNGIGFSESERKRFYGLVEDTDTQFAATGDETLFQTARNISRIGYGSPQAGRNYLYLKINKKDPFDILYFTPGISAIWNLDDMSFSMSPELLYTGFTNWEIRLRYTFLNGDDFTEFAEKQNETKFEFRLRYYFWL